MFRSVLFATITSITINLTHVPPTDGAEINFQLAYLSNVPPGNVCLVNMDGSGQSCLNETGIEKNYYDLQWSPDGSMLIYTTVEKSDGSNPPATTWLYRADTNETFQWADSWWISSWSPDSQYVLSALQGNEAPGIHRIRPDGSGALGLTANKNTDYQPAWSPDREHIAYLSLQPENQIIVMDSDGSNPSAITPVLAIYGVVELVWSPNSQQILFGVRDEVNLMQYTVELYSVRVDGSDLQRLTFTDQVNFNPRWSPDGTQIVFAGYPIDDPDAMPQSFIYVLNLVDRTVTNLTEWSASSGGPAWSPDGEWIAFSAEMSGVFGIYIMRPDGGDVRLVTDEPAQDGYGGPYAPVWRPVPSAGD
jgi:Tol biopolymer transport system component